MSKRAGPTCGTTNWRACDAARRRPGGGAEAARLAADLVWPRDGELAALSGRRDGHTIHGITTAATLRCSAGMGMMARASAWPHALALSALVVFVKLGLRPLVRWLKRRTSAGRRVLQHSRLDLACAGARGGEARVSLLRTFALGGLQLSQIEVRPGAEPATLDVAVTLTGEGAAPVASEQALARIAAEPGLARVR